MKSEIKKSGPKLTDEQLSQFERENQIRLPADYRAFLLEHNGGFPDPRTFSFKGETIPSEVCGRFFGIGAAIPKADNLAWNLETFCDQEARRIPQRMIPIADDEFGNIICLSTSGQDAGKVYFWNHEEEDVHPSSKEPSGDNLSLLADSLEGFLNQFAEVDGENEVNKDLKPWHDAIKSGDIVAVAAWLDQGGNPNEADASFRQPMNTAIEEEQYAIVELFMERGASLAETMNLAVAAGDWKVVKSVLSHAKGKNIMFPDYLFQLVLEKSDDFFVIEAFIEAGAPLNKKLQRGHALYHASEDAPHLAILKLLLERGAKPGVCGYGGRLPLSNSICAGNFECAKLMMDAGENLYFQPPPEIPSWAKHDPNYKALPAERPVDCLEFKSKKIKAIKAKVLAYAASLGQRPEYTGSLHHPSSDK